MKDNELDLLQIIHNLWSKKFFLMFCTLIPATIALIVSLFIPKKFLSEATLLSPEVAAGGGIIQTPFGGFSTSGLEGQATSSQAVIALLKSDKMLNGIVEKFEIMKKFGFKDQRSAMEYLGQKMTTVTFLPDEGVIQISVESPSPEMSKNIVEFYLKNLEKLNNEFKLSVQTPIVKVLSPAYLPLKKSFPKIKMNTAIAGLLGLIIGLLYLYIKEKG